MIIVPASYLLSKGGRMPGYRKMGMQRPRASLTKCQRGATAIEYGLILALIALAIIGALTITAGKTGNMWGNVANEVNAH